MFGLGNYFGAASTRSVLHNTKIVLTQRFTDFDSVLELTNKQLLLGTVFQFSLILNRFWREEVSKLG